MELIVPKFVDIDGLYVVMLLFTKPDCPVRVKPHTLVKLFKPGINEVFPTSEVVTDPATFKLEPEVFINTLVPDDGIEGVEGFISCWIDGFEEFSDDTVAEHVGAKDKEEVDAVELTGSDIETDDALARAAIIACNWAKLTIWEEVGDKFISVLFELLFWVDLLIESISLLSPDVRVVGSAFWRLFVMVEFINSFLMLIVLI